MNVVPLAVLWSSSCNGCIGCDCIRGLCCEVSGTPARPCIHASCVLTCAHDSWSAHVCRSRILSSFGGYGMLPSIVLGAFDTRGAADAAWSMCCVALCGLCVLVCVRLRIMSALVCERCLWPPLASCGSWCSALVLWVGSQPLWNLMVLIRWSYGSS